MADQALERRRLEPILEQHVAAADRPLHGALREQRAQAPEPGLVLAQQGQPRRLAVFVRLGDPDVRADDRLHAARQRRAYPDLAPLVLPGGPVEAFERALSAARALGWDIVAADRDTGRIEAVDTTFWFGFKDDVVIRVTPAGAGSRVDMRSKSRVGRSDVVTTAPRIEKFVAAMELR